ncbi:MAG: hypothetical protein O7D94_11070 [Planctomycetota bacterium]|nr:hypothetical protein [Planctomycetota bacterium]
MAEGEKDPVRSNWWEQMRFTQLFRAFQMAIRPTKLALAFCAILSVYTAGRLLDFAWFSSSKPVAVVDAQSGRVIQSELDVYLSEAVGDRSEAAKKWGEGIEKKHHVGVFSLLLSKSGPVASGLIGSALALEPRGVFAEVGRAVNIKLWLIEMHPFYAILFSIAWLFCWAVFGGALCRAASIHATRDEFISFGEGITFAWSRLKSFIFAPLLPWMLIGLAGFILALGGLVGAIPWVGELFVGILFVIALLIGFGIALVFIAAVGGYWLLFPTIATEGSDAADALARSFNYIYNRPWKAAFYYFVSLAYGVICFCFVKFLVRVMLIFVHLFVGLTMNWGNATVEAGDDGSARTGENKLTAIWQAPKIDGSNAFWGGFDGARLEGAELAKTSWVSRGFFKLWIYLLVGLVAAFGVSFCYSACTLVYLLLRREVDATDMEDVYLDEYESEPGAHPPATGPGESESGGTSLPVVGQ